MTSTESAEDVYNTIRLDVSQSTTFLSRAKLLWRFLYTGIFELSLQTRYTVGMANSRASKDAIYQAMDKVKMMASRATDVASNVISHVMIQPALDKARGDAFSEATTGIQQKMPGAVTRSRALQKIYR